MNAITRSPRVLRFPIVLLVLITFSFAVPIFAKHRKSSGASRSSRGKHVASSHRGGRGGGRTASRRGGRSSRRLSAREVRAQRNRIASEQASSLKALERKLRR